MRSKWERTGWFVKAKGSRHLFSTIGAIGGFSAVKYRLARAVQLGFQPCIIASS